MLLPEENTPSTRTVALTGPASDISKYVTDASAAVRDTGEPPLWGMNLMDGPALAELLKTMFDPMWILCNRPGRDSSKVKSAPLVDPVDMVCMFPLVETETSVAGSTGCVWEVPYRRNSKVALEEADIAAGMATWSHLMGLEVSVTVPAQREMIFCDQG